MKFWSLYFWICKGLRLFLTLLGSLVKSRRSFLFYTPCTLLVLPPMGWGGVGWAASFLDQFYLWKMAGSARKVENLKGKRTMCHIGKSFLRNVFLFSKMPRLALFFLYVADSGLEFLVFLPLPPKFWDYRLEPTFWVIHYSLYFVLWHWDWNQSLAQVRHIYSFL